MTFLQFSDKSVPYGVFVKDVAAEVVHLLKKDEADPEYISQRKAYEIFGRRNVERWRRQGKVSPCKRPANWNTARQTCDCYKELNRTI